MRSATARLGLITIVLILFLGVAGAVYATSTRTQNGHLEQIGNRQVCIARQIAVSLSGVGEALQAAPDSPDRDAKVAKLLRDTAKLKNIDRLCG